MTAQAAYTMEGKRDSLGSVHLSLGRLEYRLYAWAADQRAGGSTKGYKWSLDSVPTSNTYLLEPGWRTQKISYINLNWKILLEFFNTRKIFYQTAAAAPRWPFGCFPEVLLLGHESRLEILLVKFDQQVVMQYRCRYIENIDIFLLIYRYFISIFYIPIFERGYRYFPQNRYFS